MSAEVSFSPSPWYRWALVLGVLTVVLSLAEGFASVWFGYRDETLALFGFGLDSFIEVFSGVGIIHMLVRLHRQPESPRDAFETTALRITGSGFYLLVALLSVSTVLNVVRGHTPDTTLPGVVISGCAIVAMYGLLKAKLYVGGKLDSLAILADANCTRACLYMSWVLLASCLIYLWTGFAYADVLGVLGVIWFSWIEGREAFEKAADKHALFCAHSHHHPHQH